MYKHFQNILLVMAWFVVGAFGFNHSLAMAYGDISDSSELSFEKVQSIIENQNLTTVEQTLASLKQSYPDFFKNYILMYHSRSLQSSSFEAPRALLFDRSGQFVFSFNGEKSQRGYNRIEVMQYRADTYRFEFREIVFDQTGASFSKANPAKCMACHQSVHRQNVDPRPNWEPYSLWPGSFGSNAGDIGIRRGYKRDPRYQRISPEMIEKMKLEPEKEKQFFSSIQPSHARYKFLDATAFDPKKTVEFTEVMSTLNFRRVARIMKEEWKDVYQFVEPLVWGVAKCRQLYVTFDDYAWIQRNWSQKEYYREKYLLELRKIPTVQEAYDTLVEQMHSTVGKLTPQELQKIAEKIHKVAVEQRRTQKFYDIDVSRGIHHIFDPLGISTSDWSMDFKTEGRLAFSERFGAPSNPGRLFLTALEKVNGIKASELSCKNLAKTAVENYRQLKKSQLFVELKQEHESQVTANQSILNRCVKCHAQSNDPSIPEIPFDDPFRLKQVLSKNALYSSRTLKDEIKYRLSDFATEQEQMPMGPPVSRTQRQTFIEYIEGL